MSAALLVIVVVIVAINSNIASLGEDFARLPASTLGLVFVALLANALCAGMRFKALSTDVGHPIGFRQALAAVSAGNLAGMLFFQIAGQLMARGFVMARAKIPFASVVVVTFYERIVAAIVSGLLAIGGAYVVFGNLYLDRAAGGGDLIKILLYLIAATAAGAWLGYGEMAAYYVAPYINRQFARQCVRLVVLTLLVQLPMMIAYVVTAHALSPPTSIESLVATSAIVMFAASVPISLAGWGIREMSAVFALGVIGVEAHVAFLAAVIIGTGSILAMAVVAFASLTEPVERDEPLVAGAAGAIDYARALAWILPVGVATLVYFQIYLPIGANTLLNVNLADPLAILGGSLFVIHHIQARRFPQWRLPGLNVALVAMTAALTLSLLVGAVHFGWTRWALVNRYGGWFILLAYSGSGALIAKEANKDALRILLLTFAGAGAAIAVMETILIMLASAGFGRPLPFAPLAIDGFSQNHNFFAFQLLMALAAILAAVPGRLLRVAAMTALMAGIWFSGSRSGWISLACVLAAGVYVKAASLREIAAALAAAAAVALVPFGLAFLPSGDQLGMPVIAIGEADTAERLTSIFGGLDLFAAHPLFGAGLGAFRNLLIVSTPGQPPLLIHSTAVWLLAELGIVGLLVFAAPAIYLLRAEARRPLPDIAAKLIVLILVGFGVMSLPADMLYQRTFWLLFGAGLACLAPAVAASRGGEAS